MPNRIIRRIIGGAVAGAILVSPLVLYAWGVPQYISFGLRYGDWLNDWLTHMPALLQSVVLAFL